MRQQLEQRLALLREEHARGTQRVRELDDERAQLQQTLLRIAGAVRVLEETLQDKDFVDD